MIRVLQYADIINRYDFIDNIVRRANPREFEVGVCVRTASSNIASPAFDATTPYWVTESARRRALLSEVAALGRVLNEWQPDILHAHHFDQAIIGWFATRFYPKTRLVIGRHYSNSIYRSSFGIKRLILLTLERSANNAARRIIVPSKYIGEILTRWQKISPKKVDIVPYGFDPTKYSSADLESADKLREELGLRDGLVLGTFGRLHEEKGQRFLIEAVTRLEKEYPNLCLLIVGEGPERQALEKQIAEAQLSGTVRLLGWRRDAIAVMGTVDIVVQPTLQEAFSQVMVEALWMKKPLIMSKVGGVADTISHGVTGLIVPPADTAALAAAIEKLADDSDLRSQLGRAGSAYVNEHLTIDKIIPLYEHAYRRAMASRGLS